MQNTFNIDNLPSRDVLERIINDIKNCDLSAVSYQKLFYTLLNLKLIPFVTAKMKKGHHIERARINNSGQIFYSEKELTYRTDVENIKKFGRANYPDQSLFYGAIKSENIEHPRIINLFETSELFRSADKTEDNEFILTVGKWKIIQDFEVVEIVFNKHTIEQFPQIRKSYDYHIAKLKQEIPSRIEDLEFLLEFFSDEFAKKSIASDSDYKISTAYTDMAINFRNMAGVVYPSVRTDYHGLNVVLSVPAVENFLQLEVVGMFKVYKKGGNAFIDNVAYATDLGPLNSRFNWIDIKGTDEEFINKKLLGA